MKLRVKIIAAMLSAALLATLGIAAYSGNEKAELIKKCTEKRTQTMLLMHFGYNKRLLLKELLEPTGSFAECRGYFRNNIPEQLHNY